MSQLILTRIVDLRSKTQSFKMSVVKEKIRFSGIYWPYIGLLCDMLEVAYGNNTCFAEYQVIFWLALPSWFRYVSNKFKQHDSNKMYLLKDTSLN